MSRVRWFWGLAALGVVGVPAYLLFAKDPGPSGRPAHEAAEARWLAVQASASTGVPGAHLLATILSHEQSERRASGDCVTYVGMFRRRWDFAAVPMDDRRGGPVEPLLALAEAQHERLARAGFDAMSATWTTRGLEGRQRIDPSRGGDLVMPGPVPPAPPRAESAMGSPRRDIVRLEVSHQSDSGHGHGGAQVDLNAPVIVHYRAYVVPKSGVTLFVRNSYDQQERIVESEFTYSDRTLHGTPYPTGSHIGGREPGRYRVSERIVLRQP